MPAPASVANMSTLSGQMEEKAKRAADLQARIQAQLMNTGLGANAAAAGAGATAGQAK